MENKCIVSTSTVRQNIGTRIHVHNTDDRYGMEKAFREEIQWNIVQISEESVKKMW